MSRIFRATWFAYTAALAAVALVTMAIGAFGETRYLANASILYLIAVLLTASAFGSGPAVVASVAAFVAFDWFFVETTATLTVANPQEWVELLVFLLTAVMTGQLAAGQRNRAREAEQREREAVVLYDVVRSIGEPDFERSIAAVGERLRQDLDLAAVVIDLRVAADAVVRSTAGDDESIRLVDERNHARRIGSDSESESGGIKDGSPGWWIHALPSSPAGNREGKTARLIYQVEVAADNVPVGSLTVIRWIDSQPLNRGEHRVLESIGVQLGLAVERTKLRREATEGEILRRTDELKTALLHAVSHDLRTPLASIITSAGSLRQPDLNWTDGERQEFARDIEAEALRLNRLVGNILDLSRIEAGSLRPDKGWYDLGALIDDVLGRLRSTTAPHSITVEMPENLAPVWLDYVQIDQVISNVIENAAKYSPPTSTIGIEVHEMDGEVQIDIVDRGRGIPDGSLQRLFEPFFRVAVPGETARGTGLGLAVAGGIVGAHGGRIWAENRAGGGARFVIALPMPVQRNSALEYAEAAL